MSAAMLLLVLPAMAWRHTGQIWAVEDVPRDWYMDDDPEDSLADIDLADMLQTCWDAWEVAPCASVSDAYGGVKASDCPSAGDGTTIIYWDDPCDQMAPGVLGVTYLGDSSYTRTVNGRTYKLFDDTDIIFNNDVIWDTAEQIEASCSNATDVTGVGTHEIGHSWGMGHSCEQGESCSDQVLKDATMFWSVGACDTSQSDINEDDIDGITALYGLVTGFEATTSRFGKLPLDVGFRILEPEGDVTLVSAEWNFGDGATSTELAPTHSYDAENQYTVSVDFVLNTPECGDVPYTERKLGYVTSCDTPKWAEGAEGFFQLQADEGLVYTAINHTDVSTYGCVDTIEWQVYKGGAASGTPVLTIGAWAPLISFPAEGTYTVVMNVGGPGGLTAGSLTLDVVDVGESGAGCNSAPGVGVFGLFGLLALRRRR